MRSFAYIGADKEVRCGDSDPAGLELSLLRAKSLPTPASRSRRRNYPKHDNHARLVVSTSGSTLPEHMPMNIGRLGRLSRLVELLRPCPSPQISDVLAFQMHELTSQVPEEELDERSVSRILSSFAFLSLHHTFNQARSLLGQKESHPKAIRDVWGNPYETSGRVIADRLLRSGDRVIGCRFHLMIADPSPSNCPWLLGVEFIPLFGIRI